MATDVIAASLADRMIEQAVATTGLDDFGAAPFLDDYHRSMGQLVDEVRMSPDGLPRVEELIHRHLVNHLRMERAFRDHPEIAGEELAPPLVITGLARSGTTKLQQMISAAPSVNSLVTWKLLNPAPFPGSEGAAVDPRLDVALAAQKMVQENFPEMWAAHPSPATNADEDMFINDMSFAAPTLGLRLGAPDLARSLFPIPPRMYAYTRRILQFYQWQDGSPDRASRPWVLKCPIHIGSLTTILDLYPGAKIVHSHRDVETTMASVCSLTASTWAMFSDDVDKQAVADISFEYFADGWERNIEQRRRIPANAFCDVHFEEINAGAMPVIERIFAFAGLDLTDADRSAMAAWERDNVRHKHGRHVYSSADFGITPEKVETRFARYFEHFRDGDGFRAI